MAMNPESSDSEASDRGIVNGQENGDWVERYARSHQHAMNRACHMVGIPMIALSVLLAGVLFIVPGFWPVPVALFLVGWMLQFIGHAFEGKPPEFFQDWRFLFVGLRWWFSKLRRQIS